MPFGPNTEQNTKDFIQRELNHQKEKPRTIYNFVLINRIDNRLIGACAVSIRSAENKEGEIGYILNRRYWNQGYMSEAARRVVSFGFEELGLHRIFATCDPANTGSYRVMEKIRMQREGYLREYKLFKGIWRDFLLYSILEKEWRSQKEDLSTSSADNRVMDIAFLEKSQGNIDLIKPLWEKLIEYHKAVSRNFKDRFSSVTFNTRKKKLLEKSQDGALRVDLTKDLKTGEYIGYCVTSLNAEKQGEIESIYVEKKYRGSGIGDKLVRRALHWLDSLSARSRIVGVAEGNESVFAFYSRYHFYPRTTILEQKLDQIRKKQITISIIVLNSQN